MTEERKSWEQWKALPQNDPSRLVADMLADLIEDRTQSLKERCSHSGMSNDALNPLPRPSDPSRHGGA